MQSSQLRLLSGIQPTGELNLGNYIGSIQQWQRLASSYACHLMIADLHALTVNQDPKLLQQRCYDLMAWYLASGLNASQHCFFIQSHISEHAELGWILGCHTYMGELNRMTQFKEKSTQHQANINAGLFTYPALQAADILLYQAQVVPVGGDQKQHLELCRDLALRFNQQHGDTFTLPEPMINTHSHRIMNLQDPARKMSKSDLNTSGVLCLADSMSVISKKIKRAVTDSDNRMVFDPIKKPGLSNLLVLMSAVTGRGIDELTQSYAAGGYGTFKTAVAEAVVAYLEPVQHRYLELRQDRSYLDEVLHQGQQHAQRLAITTMKQVRTRLGLSTGRYQ